MGLKINPELQAVVAPLTTEEYAQLRDNIQKDGLLEPITLWAEESGTILDGHNRYAICQELGIGFRTKALSFLGIEAAKLWILEHQVGRRNLTDDQRAVIWNDIREQRAAVSRAAAIVKARDAKVLPVEDNASPTEPKPRTMEAVVAESKIPERMLRKAQKLKKTNPELYERVRSGTIALREASKPKKNDKRFAEKDYYARICRGLAASFSGVEPRLKELIAIKKSEWTPEANEGKVAPVPVVAQRFHYPIRLYARFDVGLSRSTTKPARPQFILRRHGWTAIVHRWKESAGKTGN